jgi:hypothetical protein
MQENLIYYSTNTKLAYIINEKFYFSRHFVWCSPVFNPEKLNEYDYRRKIPVSSSPYKIYKNLLDDVKSQDLHSMKIDQNKTGLKKGAGKMLENGIIDENDFARIIKIIDKALINEFSPIIYLIPKHLVDNKIKTVDDDDAANPLSSEFQIEELSMNEFEIIEF